MRFDAERAMQTIRTLDEMHKWPYRADGGAFDHVARELTAQGWVVERCRLGHAPGAVLFRVGLGLVPFCLCFTAFLLIMPVDPWWFVSAGFSLLIVLAAGEWWLKRSEPRGWPFSGQAVPEVTLASRPGALANSPLLVVMGSLGCPVPGVGGALDCWASRLLAVEFLAFMACWFIGSEYLLDSGRLSMLGWVFLTGVWIGVLGVIWRVLRFTHSLGEGEDQTSLALLLELGRAWTTPARNGARIERMLAVVDGRIFDGSIARALRMRIEGQSPGRQVLVVRVAAPGLGAGLLIGGNENDQGAKAAAGLWVPHRLAKGAKLPGTDFSATPDTEPELILAGDQWADQDPPKPDPTAMARAAQLIDEIALRWAKRNKTT